MHAAGYLTVDVHLRRARLAAHAVALDIGVFTAAFADHLFQQFAHGLGGFSPDGAGHHLRRGALQNTAVLIQNGGDDIGFISLPPLTTEEKAVIIWIGVTATLWPKPMRAKSTFLT